MSKQQYSTEEAAKLIGVKQTTVRSWLSKGLLDGTKVGDGKLWRISEDAIEDFLNNKRNRSAKKKTL